MRGETLAWFELASHLKKSERETKRLIPSSEFVMWMAYLEHKRKEDLKSHSKMEYYMAQVAYEVFRTNTRLPVDLINKTPFDKFLFDFKTGSEKAAEKDAAKAEESDKWKEKMMETKLLFAAWTGADITDG